MSSLRHLALAAFVPVALLAACTDTGAHLTLTAPDGPSNAEGFRVVLATKDVIPTIRNQRVAATDSITTREVSYYLQRTVAGADSERVDNVDGFTLRIAPDSSVSETQLIPFVVLYDSNARITGIATYPAGEANMPSPILIARDQIDKYPLVVEKTTQVTDDNAALAPGEVRIVTCHRDDQTSYPSGVVWRTLAGREIRLLLPSDGSLDATGRELDMDCDGHAVTPESSRLDCDDTRSAFHRDAAEACDGMDTDCTPRQAIATDCQTSNNCTGLFGVSGVSLCDDATEEQTGCHAVASCVCAGGGGCRFCQIPIAEPVVNPPDSGWLDVCYPATGVLSLSSYCSESNPCDVEVVGVRGGWKFEVSLPGVDAFGPRAMGVGASLAVRAKRPEDPALYEVMANPVSVVGEVDLAIVTSAGITYLPLELTLGESVAVTCSPTPTMACF